MQTPHSESSDRVIVRIDRDFEAIVPGFLANRKKDIHTLHRALADKDFRTIQMLGHRMKGDGGGYGFDRISEIGGVMELAAQRQDYAASEQHVKQLEDFLACVHIEYL
jgi:HPt (histidine-containing phosphotransfer) domain-containing protein